MQFVHKTIDTKSRKICSVPQCSSYSTTNISLHSFPADPKLCKLWQSVLKIGKPITKHMLVCSQHFVESDFTPATNKRRRLKRQVIPSQKIPVLTITTKKSLIDRSKRHWLQKCTANIEDGENWEGLRGESDKTTDPPEICEDHNYSKPSSSSKQTFTSHTPLPAHFSEDKGTETPFNDFFEFSQILNTDEKLINFTGLTFDILSTINRCAEKSAAYNGCIWSNIRDRIILVMLCLLAVALKPAIYWPTEEEVLKNIPKCFEKFKKTRVVLDCTEIKIQKLKCLKCRVLSYSHYKGSHTLKYLIGITPSGLISFVSSGFGGRATDKSIFNYERIIEKVDALDGIMVDKGFLIEEECNDKLVELIRPPFLRKQKQLSKEDAEATADIARARVHVERAIQRIKMFKILNEQFNWYLIPYADEILTIIAAIVNLSTPILADSKMTQSKGK